MTNKRLDLSVLPDNFIIEVNGKGLTKNFSIWRLSRMCEYWRRYSGDDKYRPALNISHCNDGGMVLPDGISIKRHWACGFIDRGYSHSYKDLTHFYEEIPLYEGDTQERLSSDCIIDVEVLGVHPDYADHGKELGMEVVEL